MGIEGSQFCTNPLLPSPCRCSMWVTSPLEQPLRNSRLSFTQAHQTCECPPSFAPVQSVVSTDTSYPDHPSLALSPCFHPWHLMTLISCVAATHVKFRHHQSSTFRPTNKTFRISYSSGRVKAVVVHDTVRVTV